MKTVILAGGLGTRMTEETTVKPKPLVEVGGRPILWHIMNIYAFHGFREFIVALGYKGALIKHYFLNYHLLNNDVTVNLKDGHVKVHDALCEDWCVHLVDTGLTTLTGGRLKRLASRLGTETFMMTYGDGVASVDISGALAFHKKLKRAATITAVRPPARFGGVELSGDLASKFSEKPQVGEGWVNGGFFILEPRVLDYIDSDETSFERETLERLAHDEQLAVYRHDGFWQCMDTVRDVHLLNELWDTGSPPWKIWK